MSARKHTYNEAVFPSPTRQTQVKDTVETPDQAEKAASDQTPTQTSPTDMKSYCFSGAKRPSSSAINSSSRGKWTNKEDERLLEIINKDENFKSSKDFGQVGNWTKIASILSNGRNAKQCRDRWLNYLRPGIKKGDWTNEEEDLIRELYETFGARWSTMAKMFPNRTDNDIKNKWYSMFRAQGRMEVKVAQCTTTPPRFMVESTSTSSSSNKRPAGQFAQQTLTTTPPSSGSRNSCRSNSSLNDKKQSPSYTQGCSSSIE